MEDSKPNLLEKLPNELLLIICSYLQSSDLYNFSRCDRRSRNVCSHKKFWQEFYCNDTSRFFVRLRELNEVTTSPYLSLPTGTENGECGNLCLERTFIESLRNSPLEVFSCKNHTHSYANFNLMYLPETLTQLILKRINLVDIPDQNEIFKDMHTRLPNLEVVDLSHCSWVTSHLLLPLSECPKLQKLVMIDCKNMKNITSHARRATCRGFLNLKALDFRLTDISIQEMVMFRHLENLKHILMDKPAGGGDENVLTNAMFLMASPCSLNLINFFNSGLEMLVVRNYTDIEDDTLGYFEMYFGSLRYLDITGTKCTAERVASLKARCPEMRILHDSVL